MGKSVVFRDKLKSGGEGPDMVVIPAGKFIMGSPSDEPERRELEGPQHEVKFVKPFAMSKFTVTFDDYDRYCEITNLEKKIDGGMKVGAFWHLIGLAGGWGRGRQPVVQISWHDARGYCTWLSEQTGHDYRLPSEAEWEYACRAGTTTPFHYGNNITPQQANYDGKCSYNNGSKGEHSARTVQVDQFAPNNFGIFQMHGNVYEWCEEVLHSDYKGAPNDGSAWLEGSSDFRVARGGSWFSEPGECRSAKRGSLKTTEVLINVGFRIVRNL